jgi:hypothetical protein
MFTLFRRLKHFDKKLQEIKMEIKIWKTVIFPFIFHPNHYFPLRSQFLTAFYN